MIKKLSEISYYKTGGSFDVLHMPDSIEALCELMRRIHLDATPFFVMGAGANSLIADEHWPGAVISLAKMSRTTCKVGDVVEVEAGADNSSVAAFCAEHDLEGAEWLYRLPGQFGGTIRMNARCYGGELKDIVHEVHAVSPEGSLTVFSGEQIFTGYKQTIFQNNNHIIASAHLFLKQGIKSQLLNRMSNFAADRQEKNQFLHPSCGCVFKNNYNISISSGKLLEAAGVQDFKSKRAIVSPYHANFVFNLGSATSREILELTFRMRQAVFDMFGVWLEYEMQLLGASPPDLAAHYNEKRPHCYKMNKLTPLRSK